MSIGDVLVALFTAFGIPVLVYVGKWIWDRYRWKVYTDLLVKYVDMDLAIERMSDDDMQALVAVMLTDAGFEPGRARDLIVVALPYARGIVSRQLLEDRIRANLMEEHDGNGPEPK